MSLSNVKEEIYSALDEWVAFEVEFPIIAVGKALKTLKHQQQWQRIIQVVFVIIMNQELMISNI